MPEHDCRDYTINGRQTKDDRRPVFFTAKTPRSAKVAKISYWFLNHKGTKNTENGRHGDVYCWD